MFVAHVSSGKAAMLSPAGQVALGDLETSGQHAVDDMEDDSENNEQYDPDCYEDQTDSRPCFCAPFFLSFSWHANIKPYILPAYITQNYA